jgi:hypothetical protein
MKYWAVDSGPSASRLKSRFTGSRADMTAQFSHRVGSRNSADMEVGASRVFAKRNRSDSQPKSFQPRLCATVKIEIGGGSEQKLPCLAAKMFLRTTALAGNGGVGNGCMGRWDSFINIGCLIHGCPRKPRPVHRPHNS